MALFMAELGRFGGFWVAFPGALTSAPEHFLRAGRTIKSQTELCDLGWTVSDGFVVIVEERGRTSCR